MTVVYNRSKHPDNKSILIDSKNTEVSKRIEDGSKHVAGGVIIGIQRYRCHISIVAHRFTKNGFDEQENKPSAHINT